MILKIFVTPKNFKNINFLNNSTPQVFDGQVNGTLVTVFLSKRLGWTISWGYVIPIGRRRATFSLL